MSGNVGKPLVTTNQDRCKACCTCVRECPAKAIRIHRGKAEVLPERCVGCGNCVKTCNMKALLVRSSAELFDAVLSSGVESSAVIDPAFPAEFTGMDYRVFVGMVKSLGFTYVNEGAFGADLVAERYRKLLEANPDGRYIGTNCPALINYAEMYHPDLTGRLAPIVSPMVATARALRKLYGSDLKVVFIGPCIARKTETDDPSVKDEIDAVLTFEELREIFEARGIEAGNVTPVDFDPPHAGLGALFPLAGGMLQAAGIEEDLVSGDIVTAGGMRSFQDALKEMESGTNARLLDILCCDGCIMGPGMTTPDRRFRRRSSISAYARGRLSELDSDSRLTGIDRFRDLDLSRTFAAHDMRMKRPSRQELRPVLEKLGKHGPEDELNCGACGYETCHDHAVAIFDGLAESEMCLPHTIDLLKSALSDLESSHAELADAREALEHAEKMATMGQLAAGIARGEQSAGNCPDVRSHVAGQLRGKPGDMRRSPDDSRAGRSLQEDRLRSARLREAEQGSPPAHRRPGADPADCESGHAASGDSRGVPHGDRRPDRRTGSGPDRAGHHESRHQRHRRDAGRRASEVRGGRRRAEHPDRCLG